MKCTMDVYWKVVTQELEGFDLEIIAVRVRVYNLKCRVQGASLSEELIQNIFGAVRRRRETFVDDKFEEWISMFF